MNQVRICRIVVKLGTSAVAIVALSAVGGARVRAETEHTVLAIPAVTITFLGRVHRGGLASLGEARARGESCHH